MTLSWDNLKIVLAIQRTGSLARAGVLLGMDQSTVSRRLTALEAEIGTSIFVRSRSGLSPTDTGRTVLHHASRIEREVEVLGDEISEDMAVARGLVRILGNGWVLNRLTQHVFPDLLARHPEIDLRLVGTNPRSPLRGEATLSFWFEAPPRSGDFSIPLGEVQYAVFVRNDLDPDRLPWLSFYDEDSPKRAPIRHLERMRRDDGGDLHFTSTDARDVRDAVARGVGRAILPICLTDGTPDLIRISDRTDALTRTLHLHAHPDTVQTRRVQTIIQTVRDQFDALFHRPPSNAGA